MSTFGYQEIRAKITRFRILVIGRRNAGKTLILQRLCNTTEQPEIYDAKGTKILQDIIAPTYERGLHDIENELVFKSNLGFVFHDSRGFEAGRDDEMKFVQDFIARRSRKEDMNDRIHAIWYCIPVDNSRPITATEKFFFSECGTGIVPVVVVFTQMHVQDAQEYDKAGRPTDLSHLRESAVAFVEGNYLKELTKMRYGPKTSVCLGEINVNNINCDALIEKTLSVLNNFILKISGATAQQISKKINIAFAIEKIIIKLLKEKMKILDLKHQIKIVYSSWIENNYDHNWLDNLNDDRLWDWLIEHWDCLQFLKFQEHLDQTVSIQMNRQYSTLVVVACKALALLVVSLYASVLFHANMNATRNQCFIKALVFYKEQIQCTNICQRILPIFTEFQGNLHWYNKRVDPWKALAQQLKDLVFENQLPVDGVGYHAAEAAVIDIDDWKN